MNKTGRAVLSATLIALIAPSQAWATCAANSGVFGPPPTQIGQNLWMFSFSVQNGCRTNAQPFMTDFYLPYFGDAGIANILVPAPDTRSTTSSITWSYEIQADNNLFGLPNAGVIDFHVTATPELEAAQDKFVAGVGYYGATGFSFTADFGGIEGPDAIRQTPYSGGTYTGTTLLFGDPPIPASPLTLAALGETVTPEPGTLTLLAIGLAAAVPVIRRRRTA